LTTGFSSKQRRARNLPGRKVYKRKNLCIMGAGFDFLQAVSGFEDAVRLGSDFACGF